MSKHPNSVVIRHPVDRKGIPPDLGQGGYPSYVYRADFPLTPVLLASRQLA